jgi:hypothetical protein
VAIPEALPEYAMDRIVPGWDGWRSVQADDLSSGWKTDDQRTNWDLSKQNWISWYQHCPQLIGHKLFDWYQWLSVKNYQT